LLAFEIDAAVSGILVILSYSFPSIFDFSLSFLSADVSSSLSFVYDFPIIVCFFITPVVVAFHGLVWHSLSFIFPFFDLVPHIPFFYAISLEFQNQSSFFMPPLSVLSPPPFSFAQFQV
jgi:hypothetical protein